MLARRLSRRSRFAFGLGIVMLFLLGAGLYALWRWQPERLPEVLAEWLPRSPKAKPVVYRYRDDAGRVVVSDRKPADDRPYETLEYHPERNIVPSLTPPPPR